MKRLPNIHLRNLLHWCLTSYRGRTVAIGLAAGLFYVPTYTKTIFNGVLAGSATIILNVGFLYLGVETLWKRHQDLLESDVRGDDRAIGTCIILAGALWMPFSSSSVSIQAFLWMLILIGIAWNCFSPKIFWKFPLACFFILLSMYPDYVWLSNTILRFITGPFLLENVMAQLGSITLNILGHAAETNGRFLALPEGTVEVASACTGFDMAFVLAGISLIWGLFVQVAWWRIATAMVAGIAIAFTLNIPRIVLLAFAAVYWGEESFDFWHGFWGGQIFSALMFTAYYYLAVAIFSRKVFPSKPNTI